MSIASSATPTIGGIIEPYRSSEAAVRHRLSQALVLAGRSDRAGMDEVYRLTRVKLFAVCQSIARDPSIAEDVLQDVYANVWRVAARFDPTRGTAMTWLITIARNRSLDRYRKKSAEQRGSPESLDQIADPRPSAEMVLLATETDRLVEASLCRVEARGQRLLREAFFGGFTYAELAQREGLPLSMVKGIIRRSLAKVRDGMLDPA